MATNTSPNIPPNNPQTPNANVSDVEDLAKREEWNRKRLAKNARRRERRQKAKEENPEEYKEKCEKRNEDDCERRQKAKDSQKHAAFLEFEKQKRETQKREILNDLFDSLFHENKHTFPTPVSKNQWEKLKKTEFDFLFGKMFSPGEITVDYLRSYRQGQLDFLKNNLDFPHGGSVIFYIKTMVHRPRDQRKISKEEIDYINSLILPIPEIDEEKTEKRRENYEKNKEKEIEKSKPCYEKKKGNWKNHNLNIRFMKADPNRVLSLDEITNNPFVSNFSIREEFKINLWKNDKNPEYLEKWSREYEAYEKEVAELSIEYKENFLKNKWQEQS